MFLLLTLACSSTTEGLSADGELLLAATSRSEEVLMADRTAPAAGVPDGEGPPPFATCDPTGHFVDLQAWYDTDGDGELSDAEAEAVRDAREARGSEEGRRMEGMFHVLGLVYDLDLSRILDDAERATLFEDMTARCEVIRAAVVAEYDLDGDGALSAEEEAAATQDIEAELEAERGECEGGPPPGERGGPPSLVEGELSVPPPLAAWDADQDGLFSDTELTTLRADLRERVRMGAPLLDAYGG